MVLALCMWLNVGNICMNVHEDILNSFKVTERTHFVLETATYKVQRGITKNKYINKSYGSCTLHVVIWR